MRLVGHLERDDEGRDACPREHGEVCPAGWKDGDKGMTASPEGVAAYLKDNADKL